MTQEDLFIKKIVVEGGYVSSDDAASAESAVNAGKARSVVQYLFDRELIDKDILGQALAEHFKVPYADLDHNLPPKEQILRIPEDLARKYGAVIFKQDKNNIVIATNNPTNPELLTVLKSFFSAQGDMANKNITIAYSLSDDIATAFLNYRQKLEARFVEIIKKEQRVAPEIISEIFDDAILYHVSDIHFEPQGSEVLIRYRIDGVLQDVGRIPREYYENILNRIKVQAHLRIDDHFSAQDGSLRYVSEKHGSVDARVSIMPTLEGEKIVIRILSEYVRKLKFAELGLSPDHQKMLVDASKKPFGMILVVGPTGSGKTTTLYALLKTLNDTETNITTIEDPVEYRIQGMNQVQVNPNTNLTFADGLKAIVRQDPDIILVGEIRDRETAEIAVNAALTGHLLFSTFHANDAATAIPRLLDMGVEPFLMASTLQVVIAQRLVRRICPSCRYSVPISEERMSTLDQVSRYLTGVTTLYRGKGCNVCNHTGYKGRIAIFEFISINREMQDLILKNPTTQQIWSLAEKNGARPLFEDGISKVIAGVTTIDELLRIVEPPKY